jgi:hypothetical protein
VNDETLLSWNVTNWITVVLMVAIVWWAFVGVGKLLSRNERKESDAR